MKRNFLFILIILILSFVLIETTQAASTNPMLKGFGGKVLMTPSTEITALEAATFVCVSPGTTFDITPVGSSPSGTYVIPYGVTGRGGGAPVIGRWILGLYSLTPTIITCTQPVTGATETVNAYSVTLYGTSKM